MFDTRVENIITGIVQKVHVRGNNYAKRTANEDGTWTCPGLLFDVEFTVRDRSIQDYDEMVDTQAFDAYYILFTDGVSVYYASQFNDEGKRRMWNEVAPEEWVNTSNHDSCWRSDGLSWISKLYFDMCKHVNDDVAPATLESTARVGFIDMWKEVTVLSRSAEMWKNEVLEVKPVNETI